MFMSRELHESRLWQRSAERALLTQIITHKSTQLSIEGRHLHKG